MVERISDLDYDSFFSTGPVDSFSQWNDHRVVKGGDFSQAQKLASYIACSRPTRQDVEVDIYQDPEGRIGGKFTWRGSWGEAEGKDGNDSTPSEHSNHEVDSRDRDFDR